MCALIGGGHDVGKTTKYFQDYIHGKRVDRLLKAHSPLSSFYVYTVFPTVLGEDESRVLRWLGSTAVLYHHGALASPLQTLSSLREWIADKLQIQINAVDENARDELNSVLRKMNLPPLPNFQEIKQQSRGLVSDLRAVTEYCSKESGLTSFYLSNLIFSILIDADRMDAAGIKPPLRELELNAEIIKKYAEQISRECEQSVDPERLHMRQRLFREIARKAENVPLDKKIYSLTAPTGCGKTLAGLYFALVLRERLKATKCCPRIIYVAPFLSILDQNFEVFREALGIPKDVKQTEILLQHHHLSELSYKVSQDVGTETYSSLESEILIEGWNAEIIVTTFVQFLNTVLGARASQLRKLHNLVGSIVILDEIQCIPAEWWLLLRESLKFLAQKFKMYFVLMTATQPLIFDTSEIEELMENQEYYFRKNYVTLKNKPMSVSIDEFAKRVVEKIRNEKKNLMILMNTVGSATYLYKVLDSSLPKSISLEYLSAELLPIHREEKLKSINEKLCAPKPLVLVTTQVVEAGVNLDFDGVIRDMGPVDSIIQAAGRCNREGKKNPSESFIEVFEIYDGKGTFCRRVYGDFAVEKAHNALRRWIPRENFGKLARLFYQETREGLSDEKSMRVLKGLGLLDYEKLREFVIIKEETPSCSIFIEWNRRAMELWKEYESLSSLTNRKQKREKFLEIKKELYRYVINVPEKYVGWIPKNAGFWYVSHDQVEKFYDEHTGYRREPPSSVI